MEATFQSLGSRFQVNLHLFLLSDRPKPPQIVDFERIRLFKQRLPHQATLEELCGSIGRSRGV
jgi:tRNA pseudouridine-54 N-methylase